MIRRILFFSGCLLGTLHSFCQPGKPEKEKVNLLVNLNRLTDSERLVFIEDFKDYILAPDQGGSKRKMVTGETLGGIVDIAYGIDPNQPLSGEFLNRIAALNHLKDKNHLEAGKDIELPATVYKSPLASEVHGVIETTAARPKLSALQKQNLDSIAHVATANPDYHIAVKNYTPHTSARRLATKLTEEVYDYLQKKWNVSASQMEIKDAAYNSASACVNCNVVGVDAGWSADIYKPASGGAQELWVGRPELNYNLNYSKPANLVLNISTADLAKIVNGSNSRFFFSLLNENKISLGEVSPRPAKIKLLEGDTADRPANFIPERLTVDISALDTTDFDKYYIFDVFRGDSCVHGNKVYEVVSEVLAAYNLTKALAKVEKIPINYFANKKKGDSIYSAYLKLDGVDRLDKNATGYNAPVDSVAFANYANRDDVAPENYLSAMNILYITKAPSIISSSFTAGCSANILTPSITNPYLLRNTNFIAAATNDDDSVETYREASAEFLGQIATFTEPLLSYMASLPKLGTIIVGDETSDSTFGGNYSSEGSNVTSLGMGTNWGAPNSCIRPTEFGTSFATPEVAAKLFIAKAWWKRNKIPMTSIEARRRLILSSNLNPRFIGKFASGGMVSLNKLLQTGNAYLVTKENDLIPIDTIDVSTIEYHDHSGSLKSSDFQGTDDRSLRGIYAINDTFYIFNDKKGEKWTPIRDVYKLSIACFIKGKYTPIYEKDFATKYKQLVVLKP